MRALWSDRQNCSHNVSQKVKRIRRVSDKHKLRNSQRGAKRIVRFWGGGGSLTIKCPLQSQFWRPQKMGFVWSVPVSSKENDRA